MSNGPFGVIRRRRLGNRFSPDLASDGSEVRLWAREAEVIETINSRREMCSSFPASSFHH